MNELKATARSIAMSATEYYYERVYDWRTEGDAGRWKDEFPGYGVVLGSEEPERFRELLVEFKDRPLRAALDEFRWLLIDDVKYRPRQEVVADHNLVEIATLPLSGEEYVLSGRFKRRAVEVSEDLLRRIWEGRVADLYTYRLQQALRLVDGEYLFGSQFFSGPDCCSRISEETLQDALTHPERYALVFSDYHW